MHKEDQSAAYRSSSAILLGAASFFLPCGFTQAVQVYALSTGSPVQAGAVMALFAIGTTPGLLAVGGAGALLRGKAAAHAFHIAGVVVLAFALINVTGAIGIVHPSFGTEKSTATERTSNVVQTGEVQVVKTTQDNRGYTPNTAVVYAGQPVRWEMESTAIGCASGVDLSAMGLGFKNLELGVNTFEFTPEEPGILRYQCAMGMYRAQIEVIEAP
jgi:plastocyanin